MKRRNSIPKSGKEQVRRERDPLPWRYCLLTLVCGLILVGGFFFAARQHFSAIEYGLKNAKLREQKNTLETEQRRLYLAREISLTPGEIKKAAKKIGLREFSTDSIQYVSRKISDVNPLAEKDAKGKTKQELPPKATNTKDEKMKSERDMKEIKSEIKKENSENKKEKKEEESKANSESSSDVRPRLAKK